jgi:hypothetical protein
MALSDDEWRLAEALAVRRQHGDQATAFAFDRIKTLALAEDEGGVDRWRQIAAQLEQLQRAIIQ